MMNRLDFTLPENTRTIWASPEAREVWEPRIHEISAAFIEVERLAVADGVRGSALTQCGPDQLSELTAWAARRGLVALPLGMSGRSLGGYSAASSAILPGDPFDHKIVITRPELAERWIEGWENGSGDAIGGLLGYPRCCQRFFSRWWVEQGFRDLTWWQAGGDSECLVEISGPKPEANSLLRWLGVRMVSHLPCSFDCEATSQVALDYASVASSAQGYPQLWEWAIEMLSWPIEWSALHGLAIIKTPLFQVVTTTDATADKLVVRVASDSYPEGSPTGVDFPFRQSPLNVLTSTSSFASAFEEHPPEESWLWKENGFRWRSAMEAAHGAILDAMETVVDQLPSGQLWDLGGCGNGELLRRVCERWPGRFVPCGVDANPDAIQHATELLPEGEFVCCDIFDREAFVMDPGAPVLLMPGRILEVPPPRAMNLIPSLSGRHLIVNLYGDWIDGDSSVVDLCQRAGLEGELVGEVLRRDDIAQVGTVWLEKLT